MLLIQKKVLLAHSHRLPLLNMFHVVGVREGKLNYSYVFDFVFSFFILCFICMSSVVKPSTCSSRMKRSFPLQQLEEAGNMYKDSAGFIIWLIIRSNLQDRNSSQGKRRGKLPFYQVYFQVFFFFFNLSFKTSGLLCVCDIMQIIKEFEKM